MEKRRWSYSDDLYNFHLNRESVRKGYEGWGLRKDGEMWGDDLFGEMGDTTKICCHHVNRLASIMVCFSRLGTDAG